MAADKRYPACPKAIMSRVGRCAAGLLVVRRWSRWITGGDEGERSPACVVARKSSTSSRQFNVTTDIERVAKTRVRPSRGQATTERATSMTRSRSSPAAATSPASSATKGFEAYGSAIDRDDAGLGFECRPQERPRQR